MKKIPTLFNRVFEGHNIVKITPEVTPGLEWVLEDPGVIPTVKYDGSCCKVVSVSLGGIPVHVELWKRFDAKPGRNIPAGAIPCEPAPDPITGHWPHWVKVSSTDPGDKWFIRAFNNGPMCKDCRMVTGTYEAVGRHFQGNPYDLSNDYLVRHGDDVIKDLRMSFDGIREWLETHNEEGIVFWYDGEPVCKIKRSDFGLPWPKNGGNADAKKRQAF